MGWAGDQGPNNVLRNSVKRLYDYIYISLKLKKKIKRTMKIQNIFSFK